MVRLLRLTALVASADAIRFLREGSSVLRDAPEDPCEVDCKTCHECHENMRTFFKKNAPDVGTEDASASGNVTEAVPCAEECAPCEKCHSDHPELVELRHQTLVQQPPIPEHCADICKGNEQSRECGDCVMTPRTEQTLVQQPPIRTEELTGEQGLDERLDGDGPCKDDCKKCHECQEKMPAFFQKEATGDVPDVAEDPKEATGDVPDVAEDPCAEECKPCDKCHDNHAAAQAKSEVVAESDDAGR